ncbi:MAG: hypothetical protein KDI75_01485 [Xanthomonadales bacterium]|nr:hypothetical protein [Xanthomonadales bacterium]
MHKSRWMITGIALLLASPLLLATGQKGSHRTDANGFPPRLSALDANKDGKLSAAEISAAENDRIARLDANGDGEVTAEEFKAQREARRLERQQKMMARLDTNGDGMVSTDEVKARGHERMMRLDTNGDGEISAEELKAQRHRMHGGKRGGQRRHGRPDDTPPAGIGG